MQQPTNVWKPDRYLSLADRKTLYIHMTESGFNYSFEAGGGEGSARTGAPKTDGLPCCEGRPGRERRG